MYIEIQTISGSWHKVDWSPMWTMHVTSSLVCTPHVVIMEGSQHAKLIMVGCTSDKL